MKLQVKDLSFSYQDKRILKDISLNFEASKLYAIIGKSGSGKTTLLSLLSGILKIQQGSLFKDNIMIPTQQLLNYRKSNSIIFQSYNLIPYLTPLQNVMMAMEIVNPSNREKETASSYLAKVGLTEDQMRKKCKLLSGGQQQRVAIARSLASNSDIIFADEATGNLDSETGEQIIHLLTTIAHEEEKCIICVTHDQQLESIADFVIKISDGEISL